MKLVFKKKLILKFFATFCISLLMFSKTEAQNTVNSIEGIWETEEKDGRMEIFKSGSEFKAKLLYGKKIVNEDGSSKKDKNNPNPKLRDRDIVGITYITELKYHKSSDEYRNAKIYNSENGKTYDGYIWLDDEELKLRGYLGFRWLGQTSTWIRVK